MTTIDLTHAVFDWRVNRGDEWAELFRIRDFDGTGAVITAHVRDRKNDAEFTELTIDVVETPAVEGSFEFYAGQAEGKSGFYDIQIVLPSGRRRTFFGGQITAVDDVSRPVSP